MRIALDAMGGDNAPKAAVQGAYQAAEKYGFDVVLVGQEDRIRAVIDELQLKSDRVSILHASEVIGTDEDPLLGIRRKKDSSIVKGLFMVKNGEADAFVSAGSTGALMAGAYFRLRTMPGIQRPALAVTMPNLKEGVSLMMDGGAYMEAGTENLLQYAIMGNVYSNKVLGVENPRVCLLNVGLEEEKGPKPVREAYQQMKDMDFNFCGNIEARELLNGDADVIVTDGFSGNVALKLAEGTLQSLFSLLKNTMKSGVRNMVGGMLLKPALYGLKAKFDYKEYGGAPFLGVNGCVVKAHGSSDAFAMENALRQAGNFVKEDVMGLISAEIEKYFSQQA